MGLKSTRCQNTLALLCAAAIAGCNGGNPVEDAGLGDAAPQEAGSGTLKITITAPAEGQSGVSVASPELRASLSRPLDKPDELKAVLIKDGITYYGEHKYSATNLDVVFKPFNTLHSQGAYTFKVSADGAEAEVGFTTEKAHEGALAPATDKTYDFRLQSIVYPSELASVFNAYLATAPPVLMHMVELKEEGTKGDNHLGSFLIAGSTGKAGAPKGQAEVLPEDAKHTTTTSMAIDGRVEGLWFGAGPSDLHLTASGLPLVIRDFYVTGVFNADASVMKDVRLTGLIDPVELGHALGEDIDLSFICTNVKLKKYCDDQQRIRVAATVESVVNPIEFTTFITSPVNAVKDAAPASFVQAYFSEPVDETATTVKLSDAGGAEVGGKAVFASKGVTFTPDAPLAAQTKYTVQVAGVSKVGGASDTRHSELTTK